MTRNCLFVNVVLLIVSMNLPSVSVGFALSNDLFFFLVTPPPLGSAELCHAHVLL